VVKLPAGATGFGPPEPGGQADARSFLTACYKAARRSGGKLTRINQAGVTPDFHTVVISYDSEEFAVLRHIQLPLLALARPQDSASARTPAFTDYPPLADALTEITGMQVLTAAELHTPLARTDLSQLSQAEHQQISYWKPATLGDLLFNFWD
jgi:hypothetical protein